MKCQYILYFITGPLMFHIVISFPFIIRSAFAETTGNELRTSCEEQSTDAWRKIPNSTPFSHPRQPSGHSLFVVASICEGDFEVTSD